MATKTNKVERKPAKHGLGFLINSNCEPKMFTRAGIERYARQHAAKKAPKGFWHGVVSDCGDYWRVNIGGGDPRPFPRGKR